MERVACSPRRLPDDDLLLSLRQLEFVNRSDSALPSPDIADDQEVLGEVYRIENREDWELGFLALLSCYP